MKFAKEGWPFVLPFLFLAGLLFVLGRPGWGAAALVSGLLEQEIYGLPDDNLDTYRARVRDTPLLAVQLAARDRLHPERVAIVAVGPADQLVPQLEPFGAVTVVAP